ncbi:MAG TPA: phosphatase PAP2 family protein [Acidimicrobiales bacterium]|nr:phosphatase PAP2 family protein [Acidimicrobiales bacterium]
MGKRIKRGGRAEDALVARVVGKGSRKGSSLFGRAGDIIQRPPAWAGLAALLSVTGERGRRAALRGGLCYLSAALAHVPIKALVGRRHPPGAARHQLGPMTSSFPSGHAASDLAFAIGAAQELPLTFLPLSACTMAVHWSLVRKRAHYPSDVLVGGALGIAVALAAWKVWPPRRSHDGNPSNVPEGPAEKGALGRRGSGYSTEGADASPPVGSRRWLR